jgi:5-hydroxyisourate hydrolase-like protein (transthyretin family)
MLATPRSSALWLALLVLLLGGLLAWLALGSSAPRDLHAAPSALEDARAPIAARIDAPAEDESERASAASATSARAAEEAELAHASAAEPEPYPDGLLVLVRRRGTREPVEGALVRWVDSWQLEYDQLQRELRLDPTGEELLSRTRNQRSSAADGTLRVPRPAGELLLSAQLGSAFAWKRTGASSEEPCLLELAQQAELALQVVDASGEPRAGVPVALAHGTGDEREFAWRALTAASGEARCSIYRHCAERQTSGRFSACLAFPLATVVAHELERDAAPAEPVRLVLPPTGSLRVRLLEEGGEPSTQSGTLQLNVRHAQGAASPAEARTLDAQTYHYDYVAGELVVPFVGLGLEFELRDLSPSQRHGSSARVSGPTRAGEEAQVQLARSPHTRMLRGRALERESGAPLADVRLRALFASGQRVLGSVQPIRTDAQGAFELPLRGPWAPNEPRELRLSLPHGPGPLLSTATDLTFVVPPAGADLGELRFERARAAITGRVLDQTSGAPIAGARVSLEKRVIADGGARERWVGAGVPPAISAADGAFELHGDAPVGTLALGASRAGYRPSERAFVAAGASGVELRLARGGGIEGALLVDPRVDPQLVDLRLVWTDPARGERTHRLSCDPSGAFTVDGLEPRLYTLRALLSERARPLAEIRGIEVRAGEITRDARLVAIDLRDVLRPLRVQVYGPDGERVEQGMVSVLAPELGEQRWRSQHAVEDGRATVLATEPTLELEVSSHGLRTKLVPNVRDDLDVRLEAGLALRIRMQTDPPLASHANLRFELAGRPADVGPDVQQLTPRYQPAWRGVQLGREGGTRIVLPEIGTWRVYAQMHQRTQGNAWTTVQLRPASGADSWTVEVLDVEGEQSFTLECEKLATEAEPEGG